MNDNGFDFLGCFYAVVGALIGQHKGRHLEIMNSFELAFQVIDDLIVIDRDYYRIKEEQCKAIYFCIKNGMMGDM